MPVESPGGKHDGVSECAPHHGDMASEAAPKDVCAGDFLRAGDAVELTLTGAVAKLVIGTGAAPTQIEIAPVDHAAGEYFVATFEGPRIGALVRLNEDYNEVRKIDLLLMVGVERDVAAFPRISLMGDAGNRRVRIAGRGVPTRVHVTRAVAE